MLFSVRCWPTESGDHPFPFWKRMFCKICHLKGSAALLGGGGDAALEGSARSSKSSKETASQKMEWLRRAEELLGRLQGREKLAPTPKYLGDQGTQQFSHAWTRKPCFNPLDKILWRFPDAVTEGLFGTPGVAHEFEARLREKRFASRILP